MRKLFLVLAPAMLIGLLAFGCGGDSKSIKVGDTKIDLSNKVPSDFPKDFPVYKGADVQGSATGTEKGISGTVVTWQTGDDLDKVKDFYDKAFEDGPWKSSSTGSSGDGSFWIANSADGKKTAYIGTSRSGNKTAIVVTVGDNGDASSDGGDDTPTSSSSKKTATSSGDDSSSDGEDPSSDSSPEPAELPDEANLSKDFPSDRVPFPSGSRVTSTSSFSSNGAKSYFVEVYIKDSVEHVDDYFKTELKKHGWTDAFASESDGEYFITFTGDSDKEAVTIAIAQSDTPGYAKASLSVSMAE